VVIHCGFEHEQPGKSDFGNSHVLNVFCNIIKTNVCSKFLLALGDIGVGSNIGVGSDTGVG